MNDERWLLPAGIEEILPPSVVPVSKMVGVCPFRVRCHAAEMPPGPAPMTIMSKDFDAMRSLPVRVRSTLGDHRDTGNPPRNAAALAATSPEGRVLELSDIHLDTLQALRGRSVTELRDGLKRYEEFLRGSLSELMQELRRRGDIKGEITLLVSGCDGADANNTSAIHDAIGRGLQDARKGHSVLAREIAAAYGLSRREAYEMILALREGSDRPVDDEEQNS